MKLRRFALIIAIPIAMIATLSGASGGPTSTQSDNRRQKPLDRRLSVLVIEAGFGEALIAQQAEWHAQAAREEAERVAVARRPVIVQSVTAYPRGCTIPGTFDPGPCLPKTTGCVLPEYICVREAGSINVWNGGGSGASGKYQFMPGTWANFEGYPYAAWAPEAIQDEKARQVWAGGAGCSHWAAC